MVLKWQYNENFLMFVFNNVYKMLRHLFSTPTVCETLAFNNTYNM